MAKEWSGQPHPDAPDEYWRDDETGESVCAHCAERGATIAAVQHRHPCPKWRDSLGGNAAERPAGF